MAGPDRWYCEKRNLTQHTARAIGLNGPQASTAIQRDALARLLKGAFEITYPMLRQVQHHMLGWRTIFPPPTGLSAAFPSNPMISSIPLCHSNELQSMYHYAIVNDLHSFPAILPLCNFANTKHSEL